jgi:hypothetical protein
VIQGLELLWCGTQVLGDGEGQGVVGHRFVIVSHEAQGCSDALEGHGLVEPRVGVPRQGQCPPVESKGGLQIPTGAEEFGEVHLHRGAFFELPVAIRKL